MMMDGGQDRLAGLLAAARELGLLGRTGSALELLACTDNPVARGMAAFLTAREGVSVIVPIRHGEDRPAAVLECLAAQTLAPALFEVVLVVNEADDAATALPAAFRRNNPELDIRVAVCEAHGIAAARNLGLREAGRRFATFLDGGDTVSPDYLEALHTLADYDTIPIARLAEIRDGETVASGEGEALEALVARDGHGWAADAARIGPVAFMAVAKLFPTFLRDHARFRTDLACGEDAVFWTEAFSRFPFRLRPCPADRDGLYLRAAGSAACREPAFRLDVVKRLACVDAMAGLLEGQPAEFVEAAAGSQLWFTQRYLLRNPQDWEAFLDAAKGLETGYDVIGHVARGSARTLVVSYCFPPYADPAGTVMAKRVRAGGRAVDVISNRMPRTRGIDPTLTGICRDYVGNHDILSCKESYSGSAAVAEFADAAAALAADPARLGRYDTIYSRAMWAASHYAAALIKLRHPHLKWIAEYSDPMMLDTKGEVRPFPISMEWLKASGLLAAVTQRLPTVDPRNLLFCWAEILPYALADEIVFTNENQRDYMLEQDWLRDVREPILARSSVSKQPTLPARFYDGGKPCTVHPRTVNIGYFGRFYKTRGLTEVLQALASLDEASRSRILIYVHCPVPAEITAAAAEFGVSGNIVPRPLLAYLDFLGSLPHFDYLLVNDAHTLGLKSRNPYLPSKLSDYLGAGRPIWALAEPGSVLDRAALPEGSERSVLGDVDSYARALEAFVRAKPEANAG